MEIGRCDHGEKKSVILHVLILFGKSLWGVWGVQVASKWAGNAYLGTPIGPGFGKFSFFTNLDPFWDGPAAQIRPQYGKPGGPGIRSWVSRYVWANPRGGKGPRDRGSNRVTGWGGGWSRGGDRGRAGSGSHCQVPTLAQIGPPAPNIGNCGPSASGRERGASGPS